MQCEPTSIRMASSRSSNGKTVSNSCGDYRPGESSSEPQMPRNGRHSRTHCQRDGKTGAIESHGVCSITNHWHAHRRNAGTGHVYQGRFKSFPIQDDEHFLTVCRYVERNALRADLVDRAEDWRWGSLWYWTQDAKPAKRPLAPWPTRRSAGWADHVNEVETDAELTALRRSVTRGNPLGDEPWSQKTVN